MDVSLNAVAGALGNMAVANGTRVDAVKPIQVSPSRHANTVDGEPCKWDNTKIPAFPN